MNDNMKTKWRLVSDSKDVEILDVGVDGFVVKMGQEEISMSTGEFYQNCYCVDELDLTAKYIERGSHDNVEVSIVEFDGINKITIRGEKTLSLKDFLRWHKKADGNNQNS